MNINEAREVSAVFELLRMAGTLVVIRALPLPQGATRGSSVLSALADLEYEVAADGTMVCVKTRDGRPDAPLCAGAATAGFFFLIVAVGQDGAPAWEMRAEFDVAVAAAKTMQGTAAGTPKIWRVSSDNFEAVELDWREGAMIRAVS